MPNKKMETWFIEEARKICPMIPAGQVIEAESPDFLVQTESETLGIEVTRLFQPKAASAFLPRQVESFQDKTIHKAENLYTSSGGRPVDVLVYFEDEKKGLDCTRMAECLVDFVRGRYGDHEDDIRNYQFPDVPPGIFSVQVARRLDGKTNVWQRGHIGRTLLLDHALLAGEIKRKNELVPRYREKARRVWLLLVADLFPPSANFSVPNGVTEWKFDFDFDKVLLWSRGDGKVFELRGA
ncbi:MAG: hypothetical protein ACRD18_05590 [Terriglobia bacterium]